MEYKKEYECEQESLDASLDLQTFFFAFGSNFVQDFVHREYKDYLHQEEQCVLHITSHQLNMRTEGYACDAVALHPPLISNEVCSDQH